MTAEGAKNANALLKESSPYLRQHAHNPVNWVAWSEAAFAEAKKRDVPVLVSIGYSTCHWCHVMAHECFEDENSATQMNEQFVCIKVDREEHPEVDEIYMDAVQAMSGHGGWPLNAFTDHSGRPFYACTYVPKAQWRQLLDELTRIWRNERGRIDQISSEVVKHLNADAGESGALGDDIWGRLEAQLRQTYDPRNPGYAWNQQRAPKFPPSQLLPLMLNLDKPELAEQAKLVLEAMQDSGLHDRVGGGFHRYSVDAQWRLPHFEKMLYDNAQMMGVYARAGLRLDRTDFIRTAANTGDYLLRDLRLTDADGKFLGLASAEDADDPGGEGSFYAWSPDQLREALGSPASDLAFEWNITTGKPERGPSGHMEPVDGHIPHPRGASGDIAPRRAGWERFLPILRDKRSSRPRPGRDDKIVTDLNALALEGFAALGRYADAPDRGRFQDACRELCSLIIARHAPDGLLRLPGRPAFITDYGHAVSALTAAFNLLGDPRLIADAARIADEAIERLRADDGGFYTTPAGRNDLIRRSRELTDNAYPSGQNSLAVGLMRLWGITGAGKWKAIAEGIFAHAAGIAEKAPSSVTTLLQAYLHAQRGQLTAVVTGAKDDPRTTALLYACRRSTIAHLSIIPAAQCSGQEWECLEGRRDITEPQAMICVGRSCLLAAKSDAEVQDRLKHTFK
jgi:uncharacterized protein YyaL (SSP411 family)